MPLADKTNVTSFIVDSIHYIR